MLNWRFGNALLICCLLVFEFCGPAAALAATPAELISNFRARHGEGRVTMDATLNRIAHEQATAMAKKDLLDHGALGPFSSRVAPSGSRRAAENIAYGYDSFSKTLDQWIDSSGHRRNLLLHGASRVGVASAKSTATGRTYWAMVIAGGYEQPKRPGAKPGKGAKSHDRSHDGAVQPSCRVKILGLCL